MRILLAAAWLALAAPALPALADQHRNPTIEGVISDQLQAFRADDFATAFTFASPTIKNLFGTPENFGRMVTQGYPMVYRPGSVTMLELREVAGGLWQRVMIVDEAGVTHTLDYQMVETPDGWQINAVQILPQQGVGA